jgi:hypothetical protein
MGTFVGSNTAWWMRSHEFQEGEMALVEYCAHLHLEAKRKETRPQRFRDGPGQMSNVALVDLGIREAL